MTAEFKVVAVIATYNEEDIIEACLEHLHEQGVETYLLDDGSTDRTVDKAERFKGRGLIQVERLPSFNPPVFSLDRILARKEALARELSADWLIHHDADEFRESPWAEIGLCNAFARLDEMGWNAVDFEVFNIRPHGSGDASVAPSDVNVWYERCGEHDRLQVKAWKRQGGPVDLRSSGGHDVRFEGRKVFPIPFPMRHYPIRSASHGRRKVLGERLTRFDPAERDRGWHVQYDGMTGSDLIPPTSALTPYDPVAARITCALSNRELVSAGEHLARLGAQLEALRAQLEGVEERAVFRERQQLAERDELVRTRDLLTRDVARLEANIVQLIASVEHLTRDAASTRSELRTVYASRSWRWTSPIRAFARPWLER